MPNLSPLGRHLRHVLLLMPLRNEKVQEFRKAFNQLGSFLFSNDIYNLIWHEGMLSQLRAIFSIQPPHQRFSDPVKLLTEREETVRRINSFFFSIIDSLATSRTVCESLSILGVAPEHLLATIEASNRLYEIRTTDTRASEKIQAFLDYLTADLGLDLRNHEGAIKEVLETIRTQETEDGVNALLINKVSHVGVVSKFFIKVQNGTGQLTGSVSVSDQFHKAVERAKLALLDKGFLRRTDDLVYSLEVTEAEYRGESIALPAAVGVYSATWKSHLDPYTAFTGDINLSGQQYLIKGVQGIQAKLDAAILNGCRRVFIPRENAAEVAQTHQDRLRIHFVENLIDVFLILQKSTDPLPGDTVQIRKINILKAECNRLGLQLSEGVFISDGHGQQFTVSSLTPPEMAINIYTTGKHTASPQTQADFQNILQELSKLDIPKIQLQNVNKSLAVKDIAIREEIKKELIALRPSATREEQNCDYSFSFEDGQERVVVKQFTKGTLQLQGRGGEMYRRLIETILRIYNLRYPTSNLNLDQFVDNSAVSQSVKSESPSRESITIPLPHIGTDESGKGDYFGPMVIAGVWINDSSEKELSKLGIKDSKLLSDRQCQKLAQEIRKVCSGKFEEVEISPERYNALYEKFKSEGKNLNHLLAWGHARAIESLLERTICSYAIADQFGDEKYIKSTLMEKGKELNLIQTPKGERFMAVAAASILARDRFLSRMERLSADYGITLPKGASDAVVEAARKIQQMKGEDELKNVAKLHHKTTLKIATK